MGYPLEQIVWVLFLNKGLIRHQNIWETLHFFKALTWIWFSKVNGPALPKERCIQVDKAAPEKNGCENVRKDF